MLKEFRSIIILFIIFSSIFTAAFFYFLSEKKEVELVNLKGYTLLEAINWLQDNSLEVKVFEKSDEALPSLVIISQNPAPGTVVKENRRIALIVNSDKVNYLMPNLVGEEVDVAVTKLNNLVSQNSDSLRINIEKTFSDEFPEDIVLSQQPQADRQFNQGNQIILLVSKGPSSNKIIVEDYRLRNFREVENELTQLGIIVKATFQPTSLARNVGKIFKQDLAPEKEIEPGTRVTFIVGADRSRLANIDSSTPLLQVAEFKVPINDSQSNNAVNFILNDSLGRKEIYRGQFNNDELVEYPFSSLGSGFLEIYINGELFKTIEF